MRGTAVEHLPKGPLGCRPSFPHRADQYAAMYEEEHVEPRRANRVDREEVAGNHGRRLVTDELSLRQFAFPIINPSAVRADPGRNGRLAHLRCRFRALRQSERWSSLAIRMPRDAIEVVTATYDAWNASDWGLERFHPRVEFELTGRWALDQPGPLCGWDALLDYWRRFWGAWKPGAQWEIEELGGLGDEQVLACGRVRAVGRSSGVEGAIPFFQLWTVREGLIVRLLGCDDRATALKAAGS